MDARIEVTDANLKGIQNKFDSLTFANQKGVYRQALSAAATILQKQTIVNVKSAAFRKNKDLLKPTQKKVTIRSLKEARAAVYLMGWARLLEVGSKQDRKTKKGYNRGSVRAFWFFRLAKQQTETKVFNSISASILKAIEKKWARQMSKL